jgi:hypothetical protein
VNHRVLNRSKIIQTRKIGQMVLNMILIMPTGDEPYGPEQNYNHSYLYGHTGNKVYGSEYNYNILYYYNGSEYSYNILYYYYGQTGNKLFSSGITVNICFRVNIISLVQ